MFAQLLNGSNTYMECCDVGESMDNFILDDVCSWNHCCLKVSIMRADLIDIIIAALFVTLVITLIWII